MKNFRGATPEEVATKVAELATEYKGEEVAATQTVHQDKKLTIFLFEGASRFFANIERRGSKYQVASIC
ncbi:MAG: hypothetical protein D8B54_06700 [Catonella sp.]|nr:MAG: hypothetical protein D8B54_06700 [Catonella sp.]